MRAVAGKEESYVVVGRKVYQVGFTAVVLEFGQDFHVGSLCILLRLVENFFLDNLYVKVFRLYPIRVFTVER